MKKAYLSLMYRIDCWIDKMCNHTRIPEEIQNDDGTATIRMDRISSLRIAIGKKVLTLFKPIPIMSLHPTKKEFFDMGVSTAVEYVLMKNNIVLSRQSLRKKFKKMGRLGIGKMEAKYVEKEYVQHTDSALPA